MITLQIFSIENQMELVPNSILLLVRGLYVLELLYLLLDLMFWNKKTTENLDLITYKFIKVVKFGLSCVCPSIGIAHLILKKCTNKIRRDLNSI